MCGPDMTQITLENIGLSFGSYHALRQLSFTVSAGQFVALVGPTGCGKTSVLNLVAGLLRPTGGSVSLDGGPLEGINRNAAYMFQQDGLLPWKTAHENVMLGPMFHGSDKNRAKKDAQLWLGSS